MTLADIIVSYDVLRAHYIETALIWYRYRSDDARLLLGVKYKGFHVGRHAERDACNEWE